MRTGARLRSEVVDLAPSLQERGARNHPALDVMIVVAFRADTVVKPYVYEIGRAGIRSFRELLWFTKEEFFAEFPTTTKVKARFIRTIESHGFGFRARPAKAGGPNRAAET